MVKPMNDMQIKQQGGAALVVGLVMLLAMTMLGLASTRNTRIEQQMAANTMDMNRAFQAAEAGLRDAQRCVRHNINVLPSDMPNFYGFYEGGVNEAASVAYRFQETTWDWGSDMAITFAKDGFNDVKAPPQYYLNRIKAGEGLQSLGQTRHNTGATGDPSKNIAFQIISRGQGRLEGTEVVLTTAVQF